MTVEIRPYDPETDAEGLYRCKVAFERGIGENTGNDDKAAIYEGKLTDDYRESWLAWVDRCVADEERCVTVAVDEGNVVGYVFLLPERLAFIWDAAVVNELYVAPAHRGTGVADDLMGAAFDVAPIRNSRSTASFSTSTRQTSAHGPSTSDTASRDGARWSPARSSGEPLINGPRAVRSP